MPAVGSRKPDKPDRSQPERFDPATLGDLPAPVRRYFLHAIQPGTALARSVRLAMTGKMRLGPGQVWRPLRAQQVLAPPHGFVWKASVGTGLVRFVGTDTYSYGRGRVAFRLWGLVPIVRAGGPDISRSARGRLAIESIWQPASLLPQRGVTWTSIDDRTARATVTIDDEAIPLVLTVGPGGSLQTVTMERWGDQNTDGHYAYISFGADVFSERTFGGYTVPSRLGVSWWFGTARAFEFFRAEISQATYLPRNERGLTQVQAPGDPPLLQHRHADVGSD